MARLLDVRNLSIGIKKEGNVPLAVNDISFHIDEGEILGLAGESGCGKSLSALSIPGLLPESAVITKGEIIFNDRDLTKVKEKEMYAVRGSEISVIFQETRQSLNPLMRVGAQIMEALELSGLNLQRRSSFDRAGNKEKVMQMLVSLGFEDAEKVYNAYPHRLSGGMCQRVMAAIAAIRHPRLLLADEPSSSLDAESQKRILSLLTKMNRENKMSVLIISHDLSIIRQFCSRYLVMYAGRIIEEGPSQSLFKALHPYTKALINAIPDKSKRGKKLENIPGKVPSIGDNLKGCPFAPRCKKTQDICLESFPPLNKINHHRVFCNFPESVLKPGAVNE